MSFDKKFKELRKSKALKQGEIAEIFNTDRSTIGKWEQGRSTPTVEMLTVIADYFGVSVDYLLGRETEETLEQKEPINTDGLSDNKKALLTFAEKVPEDKAAMILQVMKSIVEAD